jgi:hypothetical protein
MAAPNEQEVRGPNRPKSTRRLRDASLRETNGLPLAHASCNELGSRRFMLEELGKLHEGAHFEDQVSDLYHYSLALWAAV